MREKPKPLEYLYLQPSLTAGPKLQKLSAAQQYKMTKINATHQQSPVVRAATVNKSSYVYATFSKRATSSSMQAKNSCFLTLLFFPCGVLCNHHSILKGKLVDKEVLNTVALQNLVPHLLLFHCTSWRVTA